MHYEFVEEMYGKNHLYLRVGVLCLRNCRSCRLIRRNGMGYLIAQFADAAALMAFVGKESGLGANALYESNITLSFAH